MGARSGARGPIGAIPAATDAGGTGASGATAPAFTGTAPTRATVASFTGTGWSTSGQVVTTTESFTAAENAYAGCWFIGATKTPCLIASHPAASAGPLVLTVYGAAPATDTEGFSVLRAPTPQGSVASHTHTGPSHTHGITAP